MQAKDILDAAQKGKTEKVMMMLQQQPDLLHAVNSQGWTLSHVAVQGGHDHLTQALAMRFPRLINAINNQGSTALQLAAIKGHDKIVGLLAALDPSHTTREGWTAFHFAAQFGQEKVLQTLFDRCSRLIDATNNRGETALHLAAAQGYERIVEALLAKSPKLLDAVDRRGDTALHLAVDRGREKIVEVLLAHNCKVTAVTDSGWTALHLAAKLGNLTIVEMLLARLLPIADNKDNTNKDNTNKDTTNKDTTTTAVADDTESPRGGTVASVAERKVATIQRVPAAIAAQREREAKERAATAEEMLSALSPRGQTVVHVALENGYVSIAELLLTHKPGLIGIVDLAGQTLLHVAARTCGNVPFVDKLWQQDREALYALDRNVRTPFCVAVMHYRDNLVDWWQSYVSFDEISNSFLTSKRNETGEERLLVLLEEFVGNALKDVLNRDVLGILFGYIKEEMRQMYDMFF